MVFQSFNLWSHMTILENVIEAPIHVQKRPRQEALDEGHGDCSRRSASPTRPSTTPPTSPAASSSRAAHRPRARHCARGLMLFDEPTSALDPELVGEVSCASCAPSRRRAAPCSSSPTRWASRRTSSNRVMFLHQGRRRMRGRAAGHVREPGERPLPPVHLLASVKRSRSRFAFAISQAIPRIRRRDDQPGRPDGEQAEIAHRVEEPGDPGDLVGVARGEVGAVHRERCRTGR